MAAGDGFVPCARADTLRARHLRPSRLPCPLPCSLSTNHFGGTCGVGSDPPSGPKGELCDAWRVKHSDTATFDSVFPMMMTVISEME
jgi:hypothetical protein